MTGKRIIVWVALSLMLCLPVYAARAASVSFSAIMEFGEHLYGPSGITGDPQDYLSDGSVIYLIGRPGPGAPLVDGGMPSIGDNLVASGTTGDDILLATIRVGDGGVAPDSGQFVFTAIFDETHPYVTEGINHAYIRFFDTTSLPVEGTQFWGVSAVVPITQFIPGIEGVQFGSGATTNVSTFVFIPEPGTGQMLLLFFGFLFGVRLNVKRRREKS